MIEGAELDEIVGGVGLNNELIRWLQSYGGPEVAKSEGDCTPVIDVARVSKQSHPRIGPVLDDTGSGIRRRTFRIHLNFCSLCQISVGASSYIYTFFVSICIRLYIDTLYKSNNSTATSAHVVSVSFCDRPYLVT